MTRNKDCGANSIFRLLFCAVFGIAAGYLYTTHFEFGRIVFWISLGVAAAVWLISVISKQFGGNGRLLDGLEWCDIALFALSTIGLAVTDAHAVIQSILFGANVALLGYLLVSTLRDPRRLRLDNIDAADEGEDLSEPSD